MEVNFNDFIKVYYGKILGDFYNKKADMDLSFVEQKMSFSLFRIKSGTSSIYLGVEKKILKQLSSGSTQFSESILKQNPFERFVNTGVRNLSIGTDGVVLFQDISNELYRAKLGNKALELSGNIFIKRLS